MYQVQLAESHFPAQGDDSIRETTVGGVLDLGAARWPEVEHLVELTPAGVIGRRWTYAELRADALHLARALLTRFSPGERVAVWAPNAPEWVILEYACAYAGLTLVTVNPAYQAKELRYVLEQSRAVGLFQARSFRGNPMWDIGEEVCAALPAIRARLDLEDPDQLFSRGDLPAQPLPEVLPDDPAQIQYTSGTTGFPKGAILHHRGLTNNARLVYARAGMRAGDTLLNFMPMFHTSGCAAAVLGPVQHGCRLILARQFDPAVMNATIESERVSLMFGVPTMLIAMLEDFTRTARDFAALRIAVSGGAMVAPEIVQRITETFGCAFQIVYGQTETSPVVTQGQFGERFEDICETVGQPLPCTEISIRDPATNAVVPLGTIGEICARGYCNMIGYNDNPKATSETIDPQGWLHTGDLGTMDARGYVRVTGRIKEMIIRGGENIFPVEIENLLAQHPVIAEAAVVGLPDERWGEVVACFFRVKPGAEVSAAELFAYCRAELAAHKTPAHWIRVESFPLTGSGKIQKFALREAYGRGEFAAMEEAAR